MHNTWLKNHSYYFICASVVVIAFLVYALSPFLFSSDSDAKCYSNRVLIDNLHHKSRPESDQNQSDDLQIPLKGKSSRSHSHQISSVSGNNKANPRLLSSQSVSKTVSVSHQLKVAVSSTMRAQAAESVELVANSSSAKSKSVNTQSTLTSQKFLISSDSVKINTLSMKASPSTVKGSLPLGDDLWCYFFLSIIFLLYKIRFREHTNRTKCVIDDWVG